MPLYSHFPGNVLGGYTTGTLSLNWLSDTVKLALTTSSYSYAQNSDQTFADVTNEVSGTGYTARGQALSGKTMSFTSGSKQTVLSASNVSWTSSTITARVGVLYKDTGTNSSSILIAYFDFGSDQISNNGTFTVVWNASGIVTMAVT